MKFQFNKTAMQKLERDLNVRRRALPTLKAKETALRLEVKKAQEALELCQKSLAQLNRDMAPWIRLWPEYPDLLSIEKIDFLERNVAGVRVSQIDKIHFHVVKAGLFHQRAWVVRGTEMLKRRVKLTLECEVLSANVDVLYQARKKTTQKVNLYEKVQIPQFEEAIRRIKSFLEDQENLSRAAQKIVKARQQV